MKPLVGNELELLDANLDMNKIYKRFTELSILVINIVESLCQDAKERDKHLANLPDLKARLSELRQLNNHLEVKGNKIPTRKTKNALSRFGVFNHFENSKDSFSK